jgi:NodT family efflux transporter outer membrane factor (OMF) lipoprotein
MHIDPNRPQRWRTVVNDRAFAVRTGLVIWLALAPVVLAGSGCISLREYVHNRFKVGPNYQPPPAQVSPSWIDFADPRVKSDPATDCAWWAVFQDPVLDGLIDTAHRQNLDLRAAGTRIIEARAQRGIAVGNLFPQQQSAMMSYLHAQISENLNIPFPTQANLWATGFNGSWELDLWGRYRRSIESADANLGASVEGYGEVLVMLLADVAANYIELRTYQQRLAYARENVEIQRGSLRLAEVRFKQGASNELDVRQARSELSQTEAVIPTYEASIREASNALCVLMGMSPTDLASSLEARPIPAAPPEVALGIPADLLARRPDVRRAEREVAAQSARIGIAQADLYPSLSLNGYLGFLSDGFNDLFESKSFTGFILPQFQWNVLNYGRISNNIIVQDARLQGAAFKYQQTVLKAGQEVENGLTRFLHAQQRAKYLQRSVADAQRAVELVQFQFRTGTTDFNRVYNLQSLLSQQQDQLAAAQGSIALNLVSVYKALGGGWRCFLYCDGMPAPSAELLESLPPSTPEAVPMPQPSTPMSGDQPPAAEPEPLPATSEKISSAAPARPLSDNRTSRRGDRADVAPRRPG